MDTHYSELFDFDDEDEVHYYTIIPTMDTTILQHILKKDIKMINESTIKANEWAKFKYELLKCNEEWKVNVFDWTIDTKNLNPKCPYVRINIMWPTLENKSSRYFQTLMAIENVWMGSGRLENIWKCIDNNVDKGD